MRMSLGCVACITLLLLCAAAADAQIAINEVYPNPKAPEPEWVEVINLTTQQVTLDSIYLRDESTTRALIRQLVVPAKGYAVLTKDTTALLAARTIPASARLYQLTSFPALNNSNESVYLSTKDSVVIDSISYKKSVASGVSLERIDPTLPALEDKNLAACFAAEGATCGYANSNAPVDNDAYIQRLYTNASTKSIVTVVANGGRQLLQQASLSLYVNNSMVRSFSINSLAVSDSVSFSYSLDSLRTLITKPGEYVCLAVVSSADDQLRMNDSARIPVFISYLPQSILVNEFMYDPLSGNSEFVEFYNTTNDTVNLQSLSLHDASTTVLTINSALVIPPKGYGVIATDSSFFTQFPALKNKAHVLVQKSSFSLNSDGDDITLRDPNGIAIDALRYLANWHLSGTAITKGKSLEKVNVALPSVEKNSWTTCADIAGATPAAVNSVAREIVQNGSLSATPNPFSPRSLSATKQSCIISYSLPFKQARVNADVYDVNGQKIRNIANNIYSAAQGAFVWDGRNEESFAMSSGAYIVAIEAVNTEDGSTHQDKMLLVIGE